MENHAQNFSKKKQKLMSKKLQHQMESFISTEYLEMSLESNFYSALKTYFIFKDPNRLISLLRYVEKKENSSMILDNILLKYGLKIIDKNMFSIDGSSQKKLLQNYDINQLDSNLNLSQI